MNCTRKIKSFTLFAKLFWFCVFLFCQYYSQAEKKDSLQHILKKQTGETRLKTLKLLADVFNEQSSYDSSLIYSLEGIELSNELKLKKYIARFYSTAGVSYWSKSENKEAIAFLKIAVKTAESIKDEEGLASIYNNMGLVYFENSDYPKALLNLTKSEELCRKLKDKSGMASCLLNIGLVYDDSQDYTKAFEYYERALKLAIELKEDETQMICYSNMGVVFDNTEFKQKAMEYHVKSLQLAEKIQNKRGMALSNNNIGALLFSQKKYDETILFYINALKIYREIKDVNGMALVLGNMGDIHALMGKHKKALGYFQEAMIIADTSDLLDHLSTSYIGLAHTYAELGNFKDAYKYHALYKSNEDTLFGLRNMAKVNDMQTQFEVKQKENELNIKQQHERAINKVAKKQQMIIIVSVAILLLLSLVFAAFLYTRIKISLKQNKIIHEQKHIVEEKNREITDSINYAKRIQRSVLTSENYLKQHLQDVFVLFLPKDIVAGDFYWGVDTKSGFLFATADCTGHGVPGAFMSVMGINFLNEITIERGIHAPDKILNELRKNIIKTINQEGNEEEGKDGMDISLYLLNKQTMVLTYAAANNPIWIIGKNGIQELEPDKMPIGIYNGKENTDFRCSSIKLEKGDMIYSFTDGYPDQFGGEKGKKFKYANLKKVLSEVHELAMDEQKKLLHTKFEAWKGKYEQTDDICVIGVKA